MRSAAEAGRSRGNAADDHRDHDVRQPFLRRVDRVPYLPAFWRAIGPFLPPRNAYFLLHNAIYFHGHGTTQALVVVLIYFVIPAVVLSLLGWFRSPRIPITPDTEAEATAVVIPIVSA